MLPFDVTRTVSGVCMLAAIPCGVGVIGALAFGNQPMAVVFGAIVIVGLAFALFIIVLDSMLNS